MTAGRYRMVVTSGYDHQRTLAKTESALTQWLTEKRYQAPLAGLGRHELADGVSLDIDAHLNTTGLLNRWRLRETGPIGTWQSLLVLRTPPGQDTWLQLDVDHQPLADQPPVTAQMPRLARALLGELAARDGRAEICEEPQRVGRAHVDDLIDVLCDEDRRLPVVVVHPDPSRWGGAAATRLSRDLPRALTGVASLYVLDSDAVVAFNTKAEHHWVGAGGIRTYLPGVDPASELDAHRHRVMSARTVAEDPNRAISVLARNCQLRAQTLPLPAALDRLPVWRSRQTPVSAATGELERLRAENRQYDLLLEEAGTDQALTIDELRETRDRLAATERDVESLNGLWWEADVELQAARDKIAALERHIASTESAQAIFAVRVEDTQFPESFQDLLDQLAAFKHVQFTGDPKDTASLDEHQRAETWLRITWRGLLALEDYAAYVKSHGFAGGFKHWCAHTPRARRGFQPGKVALDESQTVRQNQRMAEERRCPVPLEVDPTGRVFMGAHLAITGGIPTPRLHYHDAVRKTGKIYVGYLGLHLTNTLTH